MNTTGIPLKDPAVSAAAGDTEQLERAYIDASTRVPVLMFYTSAIAWLILGTVLAMVVSFKLHSPDLLSGISFLTWGRLRPAHMNVMVYGWAQSCSVIAPVFNGSSFRVTWPSFCLSLTCLWLPGRCSCFGIGAATKFTSRNGIYLARSSGSRGSMRQDN